MVCSVIFEYMSVTLCTLSLSQFIFAFSRDVCLGMVYMGMMGGEVGRM
jgi:hypothetical protein